MRSFSLLLAAAALAMAAGWAEARPTTTRSSARQQTVRRTASVPAKAPAPANPYRKTPYVGALSLDADTGRVLFAEHADDRAYPASVTKLMTAYLVLDEVKAGRLRLNTPVTASSPATAADRWARQPSCTGLVPGAKMSVDELLRALMVHSANDAAVFLAEACAGSAAAFVERMNAKAQALGMTSTVYYNPNGLPPPPGAKERKFNVSTCRDQALLARALLRDHPGILTFTSLKTWRPTCLGEPMTTVDPKTKQSVAVGAWINHNNVMVKDKLKVRNPDGTEAVDGLKTGYIDAGGSSVVLTGRRNGRRAIVIVLGSSSAAVRDESARSLLSDALDALAL